MTPKVLPGEALESVLPGNPAWDLVQRILRSPGFARSPRLSSLLTYVAERKLLGFTDELSEQLIAVRVFGRPPGYNASEDSIVRSQARLLRQKLAAYFQTEGASEELVLEVPKGAYVPRFVPRQPPALPVPAPERATPLKAPPRRRLWTPVFAAAYALLCAAIGYWIGKLPAHPAHPFWSRVKEAILVIGGAQ
jgi:hypothetical protein